MGCNQENASYPVGICAERSALFGAQAQYPDVPVTTLAIAARYAESGNFTDQPVGPCGICRQALLETEHRLGDIRILLYSAKEIVVVNRVADLLPLQFTAEDLES